MSMWSSNITVSQEILEMWPLKAMNEFDKIVNIIHVTTPISFYFGISNYLGWFLSILEARDKYITIKAA